MQRGIETRLRGLETAHGNNGRTLVIFSPGAITETRTAERRLPRLAGRTGTPVADDDDVTTILRFTDGALPTPIVNGTCLGGAA